MIPGGVNSPVRAMKQIGRSPIFIERGEGPYLWDVDGQPYVDWVSSWGPLILGHADPVVVEAVRQAAGRGTSYGAPTPGEVELATEVVDRFASVEMIRFTEATMSALRLARAATGRSNIVKFAGAYHGHVDGLLAEGGSGLATAGVPASPGVTEAQASDTVIVPWNDEEAAADAISRVQPAAVIAEPVPANMGVVPPATGFLEHVRDATAEAGALLIRPDSDGEDPGRRSSGGGLRGLARADGAGRPGRGRLSGGDPCGQPGGGRGGSRHPAQARRRRLSPSRRDHGNPGERAAAGDRPVQVESVPGLVTVFFSAQPVRDFAGASASNTAAYGRFCRAMLDRGVYPPASQFEAWFPSLAHEDDALAQTIDAAEEAFREAI